MSLGRWIVAGLLLVLLAGVGPLSAKVVQQEAARAAVRANDAAALLAALENGADANWADSQGTSLLHSAAALESMELVDVLLAAGADRMATSLSGSRPAHVAAGAGSLELAARILGPEYSIEARDGWDRTFLHYAVRSRRLDLARRLLAQGAEVDPRDRNGRTPLLEASSFSGVEMVRLLVEWGADFRVRDAQGSTALHRAVAQCSAETIRYLLGIGLDPNRRDDDGKSPLAHTRDVEVANILLQHGASPNLPDKEGRTPFYFAVVSRSDDLVEALVPFVSFGPMDRHGNTALHMLAKEEAGVDSIELLVDRGADVNAVNAFGRSALHQAFYWGRANAVRRLLALGADPGLRDVEGERALNLPVYGKLRRPVRFALGPRNDAERYEAPVGSLVRISMDGEWLEHAEPAACKAPWAERVRFERGDVEVLSSAEFLEVSASALVDVQFVGMAFGNNPTHGSMIMGFMGQDRELRECRTLAQLVADSMCTRKAAVTYVADEGEPIAADLHPTTGNGCDVLGGRGLSLASASSDRSIPRLTFFSSLPMQRADPEPLPAAALAFLSEDHRSLVATVDLEGDGSVEYVTLEPCYECEAYGIYRFDGTRMVQLMSVVL